MSNIDKIINNLAKGQSIVISSFNNTTCSVERTADGKKLRFVRTFESGSFEIYKTMDFYFV